MKLTVSQQRKLIRALPVHRRMTVQRQCRACQMQGQGIKEIMSKARSALGPIAKEIGPKVMKELIIPLLLKKLKEKAGVSGEGRRRKRRGPKRSP